MEVLFPGIGSFSGEEELLPAVQPPHLLSKLCVMVVVVADLLIVALLSEHWLLDLKNNYTIKAQWYCNKNMIHKLYTKGAL